MRAASQEVKKYRQTNTTNEQQWNIMNCKNQNQYIAWSKKHPLEEEEEEYSCAVLVSIVLLWRDIFHRYDENNNCKIKIKIIVTYQLQDAIIIIIVHGM